ncbi:hypothetical protein CU097_011337 [Rhizopus azygosporus]|uniref:Uncharacterized protein n=1 Tax=Rhizopus azygosporus TaxID=86630 RepID=A0A367JKA8_RHIAZ|nr:hypothetical protein CU097_011337 [Rhizopus azygosporus]
MRSRKDPATDCKDALLELVSLHWVEHMAAAESKEQAENEYEVWKFIIRAKLGSSADILGFDCSPFLKKYFEYQSPGVRTDLDSRNTVNFECRLCLDVK